jgi:RND family efflux transporter MFP subunit
MSVEHIKTPSRRSLVVIAVAVLILAATVAARGITGRNAANHQVAQWTDQQVVPTVQLAKLSHGDAFQNMVLPGNVQPYSQTPIYARVPGYLKAWQEDIGAHVHAGQVLATIDTPDLDQQLLQAKANLRNAQVNARLAADSARRWTSLLSSGYISQDVADQKTVAAAAAQATMESYLANVRQLEAMERFKTIVAPFDGVVTQRNTDVGALINSGAGTNSALFQLSDLHKVRIYVQVPQSSTGQLRTGLPVTFDMPQYPGRKFAATFVRISRATDPTSHSMLVELSADNPDGKLFSGAYCQVTFKLPGNPDTVRVPATALMVTQQATQVALLGNGGKVTLKTVEIGQDFGDSVTVRSGLRVSDRVIDNPPTTLQNGDAVQLASNARPGPKRPAAH